MIKNKKVIVVMPARDCERTLEKTFNDLPHHLIDEVILVDNKSRDQTSAIATKLGISVFLNKQNEGYGGSQKRLYALALKKRADIIIMLHPDYQYDPKKIPALIEPIVNNMYNIMFGSRMYHSNQAIHAGMPLKKYLFNKLFSKLENMILGVNFTEHFSGFRAYSKTALKILPFYFFSNDYIFDQQLMISAIAYGFRIGEIPIHTSYSHDSSSIGLIDGTKFLLHILFLLFLFALFKWRIYRSKIFIYKK